MACVYTVNGVGDLLATSVFQLVEDINPESRTPEMIEDILLSEKVIIDTAEGNRILNPINQSEALSKIDDLNTIAVKNFNTDMNNPLIRTIRIGKNYKILVDYNVLKRLKKIDQDVYDFTTKITEPQDGETGEYYTAEQIYADSIESKSEEIESIREDGKALTELLIQKLEGEIRRLQESAVKAGKRRSDQVSLKQKEIQAIINKIKKSHQNIEDLYTIVHYLHDMSVKAESQMKAIEDIYEKQNALGRVDNAAREALLRKVSELKQTIDAFYSNNTSRSAITLLGTQVTRILSAGMTNRTAAAQDLLEYINNAEARMRNIDSKFLDSVLPIHVDYLLEYAPIDINTQLNAKITRIKENKVLVDFNRFDVRYLKARAQGFEAMLELNIKQLQDKMIGREAILSELKSTHREAGFFSTWLDPIVYNRKTSIQLFANAVKGKLFEAYQSTIDTKYELAPAYRKFVDYKGVGEDNVEKLYEDIIEEISISTRGKDGERKIQRVMAFVQRYNVTKFNENLTNIYNTLKEQFNFPKDADPIDKDKWFKSPEGIDYQNAIDRWWKENTVPTENAEEELAILVNARLAVGDEIANFQGSESDLASLYRKAYTLEAEMRSVYSNNTFKGRLAVPNNSYINEKFTQMPAEAREYYDLLLETYKNDQLDKIGGTYQYKNSWDNFSYLLPSIGISAAEKLYSGNGVISSAKRLVADGATFQETDTEFGELVSLNGEKLKLIPLHFAGTMSSNLVSKDVTNSIIKFNDMANRFKSKSEINGVVNIMRSALENRKRTVMLPTGDFATEYYAEKHGIKKLYENINTQAGLSGDLIQLNEWLESIFYDKQSAEQFKDGLSTTKITSALTSFTAIGALGLNVPQAFNQYIMDNVVATQEAVSGGYFTAASLGKAKLYMGNSIGNLMESASGKMTKSNKIGGFLELVNAFQEGSQSFENLTGSAAKKASSVNSLTFMQKAADISMMGEKVLAMAFEYKGKLLDANGNVIKNKAGEDADLYDMIIQDSKGKWIVDPQVANFSLPKFVAKVSAMSKSLNQLRGSVDVVAAQRRSIPRLMLLFRSYFVPGLRRRFGYLDGAHIDVESGELTNGYYNTFFGALMNLYYTKSLSKTYTNLTPSERKNMHRALMEFTFVILAGIVASTVRGMFDDDDEKNPYWAGFVMYQALRLNTELSSFLDPLEFIRMAQSPTATFTPVKNAFELLGTTTNTIGYGVGFPGIDEKDVFYQRQSGIYEKGDLKITKELTDVLPLFSGVSKSLDPERIAKFYEDN